MQTTEILELVQDRTGNESTQIANDLLNAVLKTLAERDLGGAQTKFAAHLPEEFSEVLRHGGGKVREQFDAAEFVRRVAERADITDRQSETWTRATLSALVQSVTAGPRDEFVNALPTDLHPYAMWDV